MQILRKVRIELRKLSPPGTMRWLSTVVGVHESYLSQINRGKVNCSYNLKIKIANVFRGVSVEDLFGEDNE